MLKLGWKMYNNIPKQHVPLSLSISLSITDSLPVESKHKIIYQRNHRNTIPIWFCWTPSQIVQSVLLKWKYHMRIFSSSFSSASSSLSLTGVCLVVQNHAINNIETEEHQNPAPHSKFIQLIFHNKVPSSTSDSRISKKWI